MSGLFERELYERVIRPKVRVDELFLEFSVEYVALMPSSLENIHSFSELSQLFGREWKSDSLKMARQVNISPKKPGSLDDFVFFYRALHGMPNFGLPVRCVPSFFEAHLIYPINNEVSRIFELNVPLYSDDPKKFILDSFENSLVK